MSETIFSRILSGDLPADFVYQDDQAVAFRDVNPAAPVHILVIPREPLESVASSTDDHAALLGHLMAVCRKVAADEGLSDTGYRIVTNIGEDGGQSVDHLHFHVLGGRRLEWPPG